LYRGELSAASPLSQAFQQLIQMSPIQGEPRQSGQSVIAQIENQRPIPPIFHPRVAAKATVHDGRALPPRSFCGRNAHARRPADPLANNPNCEWNAKPSSAAQFSS
jgi:hypothetical protein